MRGRKPKPTKLKMLQGTMKKCRINTQEPIPSTELPRCPAWIGKRARAFWTYYAKKFHRIGILTDMDQAAFGSYCNVLARLEEANRILDRAGVVILNEMGRPMKNPAFVVAKDCWQIIKGFSVEFCLTPSSRVRVKVPEPKVNNKFQEFLWNG